MAELEGWDGALLCGVGAWGVICAKCELKWRSGGRESECGDDGSRRQQSDRRRRRQWSGDRSSETRGAAGDMKEEAAGRKTEE
jgi:hypothetical protein